MDILPRDTLIALSVFYQGDWGKTFAALKRHDYPEDCDIKTLVATVKSKTLTMLDPEYPAFLKDGCVRPPLVLYYYGDLSLMMDLEKMLTVVGPRAPSEYASAKTRSLCREMVDKGYILVSGLAKGIDTIAAEEGVRRPGHAIAVMGCGIERVYPLENTALRNRIASTGLLLSEYPGLVPPDSKHFPMRNRILAGLGKAVFASEVAKYSGTSITVGFAAENDRDVGTLPRRADEEYLNNAFIKNGAALIETSDDLVLMMEGKLRFWGKLL